MKTAVLISGQLRTFKKCYPTQRWQIFRHYEPDIHFFASISGSDDASLIESILLEDYKSVYVESYDDPIDLPDIPIQKGAFAPYANTTSHPRLMLQHWGNKKVWDFFASSAATESFDVIIRIRPDLWIHRFRPPRNFDEWTCVAPWWGKFGGINDRLAILGNDAANRYFNLYDSIPEYLSKGCPFHPETLLLTHLQSNGVNIESNLMTEFSTERMDGSRRWAEIVMSDMAELVASK